jgi:hypothetical protein
MKNTYPSQTMHFRAPGAPQIKNGPSIKFSLSSILCLITKNLYEPFWPKAFRGPLSPMETLDQKTTIIKKCLEFYFLEGLVYSKNPKC